MKTGHLIGLCAALLLLVVISHTMDYADAQRADALRAEMETIFCESGGEYGWPPVGGRGCDE